MAMTDIPPFNADDFTDQLRRLTATFGDETRRQIYFYIRSNPGATANVLAEAFGIHANVARHHLDRLEEAGLVERQSCPTDRRATYVAITEAGNRAFEEAVAVHIDTLGSTMGSRLNARERETLAALLTKLSEPA